MALGPVGKASLSQIVDPSQTVDPHTLQLWG